MIVTYSFENDLTFLDICKIVAHFRKRFEPVYYAFFSEATKVISNNQYSFNLELKNNEKMASIKLDHHSVSFYDFEVKEALTLYEEICDTLTRC